VCQAWLRTRHLQLVHHTNKLGVPHFLHSDCNATLTLGLGDSEKGQWFKGAVFGAQNEFGWWIKVSGLPRGLETVPPALGKDAFCKKATTATFPRFLVLPIVKLEVGRTRQRVKANMTEKVVGCYQLIFPADGTVR